MSYEIRAQVQRSEERAELAVLLSKRKDWGLETWVAAHVFARRVTRYAGLSGSGVCREKATKAADGCSILEKGRSGGFFTLETEVKVLRASGRARLGMTCNSIQSVVWIGYVFGLIYGVRAQVRHSEEDLN